MTDAAAASAMVEVDGPPVIVIAPAPRWARIDLGELWRYRELLYFLTWRDVKVRYKQTAIGIAWALVQPLFTMIVFSVFFGRLAKVPSDNVPYPVFALAGLVPWALFASGITGVSNGLVDNANLIKKVYFPRLAIPISAMLAGVFDFLIAFALLALTMGVYGFGISAAVFWLPGFVVLAVVAALGTGLWFAALNARYRDVRYVLPFVVQLWMFATPIAYSSSLLTPTWRAVYGLNPMVGVVEGFRWALLGAGPAPGQTLVASSAAAIAVLVTGAAYFRRMEKTFADVL